MSNCQREKMSDQLNKEIYGKSKKSHFIKWAQRKVSSLKSISKRKRIPFDVTYLDILLAVPRDLICPALKKPLEFNGPFNMNSPSIDRIIPSLGYTRGNIAVISYRANIIKRDSIDANEFRYIADYMDGSFSRLKKKRTTNQMIRNKAKTSSLDCRLTDNQILALGAIRALNGNAYGAQVQRKIKTDTGADVSQGRLNDILSKFEERGWLTSSMEKAIKARGRKTVRIYRLTEEGSAMLDNARTAKRRAVRAI
ncbi:MAG: PadR family transcriptional regulator [Geminicoccaceae bacterium]